MRKNPDPLMLVRHYAIHGKTLQKVLEEHGLKRAKNSLDHLETAAHDMV